MARDLPLNLLRSLIAVAEAGSMSRAASDMALSPSALSLRMKRLSELVHGPILQPHNRGVQLTTVGRALLTYATSMVELNDRAIATLDRDSNHAPVRLGLVEDFTDNAFIKGIFSIARSRRNVRLRIQVDKSSNLTNDFAVGLLDAVFAVGSATDPKAVARLATRWIGDPHLCDKPVLPLAVMEKPCIFREHVLESLEHAGRRYEIMLETSNVNVLRTAVDSGLAVTCRIAMPREIYYPPPSRNLPLPPAVACCLLSASNLSPACEGFLETLTQGIPELLVDAPIERPANVIPLPCAAV
jgi:DNA-binding transcriptional LysR family regulator